MTVAELQHAIGTVADGQWGPKSRAALLAWFVNTSAPAITPDECEAIAKRLGCTVRQLAAVAQVESAGSGFDANGRPKMLYERHIFWRQTGGLYGVRDYSNPARGGYNLDNWAKLANACGKDPDAAFASASWGKFQVMGEHWKRLGYLSPFALASSCRTGEAAHYELLARFIETMGLKQALAKLSADPRECAEFASEYNGPGFHANAYDVRLAQAMREL